MMEATIKVLPRPETEETLTILGLDDAAAVRAMSAAMGLPCEVSGAAHLPAAAARRIPGGEAAMTALRLEGVPASIAHRRRLLEAALQSYGTLAVLPAPESQTLWHAIRDVRPFAAVGAEDRPLWRISTAPAAGAEVGKAIAAETDGELFYDWAGGLIWLALPPQDDAGAEKLRRALRHHGGHATLIRAPAAARAAVQVFEPEEPALAALTRRVKESFDPQRLLNPGRMWAGT
jgi:glycolate oxidase FAD binding subunit